ncbi:MAG: hypothetical protein NC402_00950 [Prevotella sp.]|nr:hypothetical protein [Prevotella sp.]MCM1074374.1 hypothetical protein [Ruminococcus sp.]
MKRFSQCGLPVLLALLAYLGFSPQARAYIVDPAPYESVTIDPTPGVIDDITKLQKITFLLPGGGEADGDYFIASFNTLSNPIIIRQVNDDNSFTTVGSGRYKAPVKVDATRRNAWTAEYNKTLADLDLTPGKYQIYIAKAGTFQINKGTDVIKSSATANSPANMIWEFTYAPGGAASAVPATTPTNASIISDDDFVGVTVSFEGAKSASTQAGDLDGVVLTCNGEPRLQNMQGNFTFKPTRGDNIGLWEFTLPEGFYKLTLEDDTTVDSPAVTSYFYVGDLVPATTPINNGEIGFSELSEVGFTLAYPEGWTVTPNRDVYKNVGYMEYGSQKMMAYYTLLIGDDNKLQWVPMFDTLDITNPTENVNANVFLPEGTYTLTYDGKQFKSPAINFSFVVTPSVEVKPAEIVGSIDPANGTTVESDSFGSFTVDFTSVDPTVTSFAMSENCRDSYVTLQYSDTEVYSNNFGLTLAQTGGTVTVDTPLKVKEPTTITISIHEGAYTCKLSDGRTQDSPAVTSTFTLKPVTPAGPTVMTATTTPANGATLKEAEFTRIDLTFSGAEYNSLSCDITKKEDVNIKIDGKVLTDTEFSLGMKKGFVKIADGVSPVGVWDVTLPEGLWAGYADGDDPVAVSPALHFTFTVEAEAPVVVNYTTVPAQDAQVDELESFSVNFTDATNVDIDWSKVSADMVTLKHGDTTLSYGSGLTDDSDDPTTINLDFKLAPTTPTLCTVNFKEGAYTMTLNGKTVASPAIEFSFTVGKEVTEPAVDPANPFNSVTIEPAPGQVNVANLQTVTLTAPEGYGFTKFTGTGMVVQKKDEDGDYVTIINPSDINTRYNASSAKISDDKSELTVTLNCDPTALGLATNDEIRIRVASGTVNMIKLDAPNTAITQKQEKTFEYTALVLPKAVYTTTPADGATVANAEDFTGVTLAFTNATKVALNAETFDDVTFKKDGTQVSVALSSDNLTFTYPRGTDVEGNWEFAIPEGFYTLTIDGQSVPSPAISIVFKVGDTKPVELTWTTTPEADAEVDELTEFAVNFADVKEYAWANDSALPEVTLSYNGSTMSYNAGFVEGDDINIMVLDTPLSFDTPTQVTATFAAGLYTLTMNDGSEQTSPAVEFTFTVGKAYTGPVRIAAASTTPAANAQVDELTQFSVNFADVKEIAFMSEDPSNVPAITLSYGNTTLSYPTDFAEGDDLNIMELSEALTFTKPTQVTAKFAEGIYKFTMEDGSEATNEAVEFTFTVGKEAPIGDDAWVPLTDINQLDGAEVVFAWYYSGKKSGLASAPDMQKITDPVTNGVESCIVMSNQAATLISGGKFYQNDYTADGIDADNFVVDSTTKRLTAIRAIPETATIAKAIKTEGGYAFQWTNYTPSEALVNALGLDVNEPLYFAPQLDKNTNRQSLQPSNTAYDNAVTISSTGYATMRSTYRKGDEGANVFTATTEWALTGPSYAKFCYMHQELDLGHLYILVKKGSMGKSAQISANPATQSTIEGSTGTEEITFSVEGYENAAINADVTPTATFNGEAANVTFGNTYPVKATVTVPANADGKLVISIPAGWLKVEDGEDVLETSAYEYTLNFATKLAVADVKPTIDPVSGSTVQSISTITVTFPAEVTGIEVSNNPQYEAILNGRETSTPILAGNTTFRYRPELTDAGTYTFTLKEGFYILTMADGSKALSPELSTTVTISPYASGSDVKYTTTPEQGSTIKELTEFSVAFEGVSEVAFGNIDPTTAFTVSYGTTTLTYGTDFEEGAEATAPVTTMVMKQALTFPTATTVTVRIAEGAYLLTLADETVVTSPAVEFSFTVDENLSISAILGDAENRDVYTTTGIRVLKNASNEEFKQLAPGLYIVGGKVVYKK